MFIKVEIKAHKKDSWLHLWHDKSSVIEACTNAGHGRHAIEYEGAGANDIIAI